MTNDRQAILGRVSAGSPESRTVHLTELLPVEHSRITEDHDCVDQETTDGLRALRSFARGEHRHFVAQSAPFDSYKRIDRAEEDDETTVLRRRGKRKARDVDEPRSATFSAVTSRSFGRAENDEISEDLSLLVAGETRDDSVDEYSAHAWNGSSIEGSEWGEDRLDTIDAEDQIYYYRQRSADTRGASDQDDDEDERNGDDDGSAGVPRVPTSTVCPDEAKRSSAISSPNGDAAVSVEEVTATKRKRKIKRRKNRGKRGSKGEESSPTGHVKIDNDEANRERARRDLRIEMNGIIEASNCLLERENNNVEERNHNEIDDSEKRLEARDADGIGVEATTQAQSSETSRETSKKYRCVICDSSFKGSGGLRNHYKVVHAAGPIYKCDECGKEFPLKERLKLHVRTHTGFKPYQCPDCHKSFARGGQLVQHRGTHSKIKPYRCNLCAGTFTCAANLALHLKRHNGQKDHKCEICGRGFVRKDALKKHLECLHRDVKSFLCSICNKTFKGHLPQHMRTHAQDRPHGCATCGQRFAQKSQLTVHQRTHSGQRPFRCLVCWQAFAHSTALKLHTRRHTGERPFKCAECNAGFTQLPHWKKHMKCIHGRSEPYSCKNCKSFFRIKNDLENHEKACHCDESTRDDSKLDDPDALPAKSTQRTLENGVISGESPKFRSMNVERMRLLLAVLLKRISRPERLDQLGFGKRLIDEVLQDSLLSAGKEPSRIGELDELESLRRNLETFLEWTVPKEHWEKFRRINKTPEEILETLTAT